MNHSDYCTHIKYPEDKDVLTRPLFDVNMRLFETSPEYRKIVVEACKYIRLCGATEKAGYKRPHGWSGANAGIPFNIISVNRNGHTEVMINPIIKLSYGEKIISESNCGSLTLEKPIKITRHEFIDWEYFTIAGNKKTELKVDRKNGGLTIQHEVEHNLGILILYKQ